MSNAAGESLQYSEAFSCCLQKEQCYFNKEISKPPLAPKPKIIGHLSPAPVSKFSPSLPRADILHNPNSGSRGPKPPIAPKPKFSADTEGKSSVSTNNNLNKCANGKLVCLDGELCEGNQCNANCLESEADNEYIVVPEAQLPSKDCNDLEHEHDQNLDSSVENEVSETPEKVEKEEDNIASDQNTSNREVIKDEHCTSSDTAEPGEPDCEESSRDCDQSKALCEESLDAPDGDNDAAKKAGEDEDAVRVCTETKNRQETSYMLELVKNSSDCETDSDNILNRDEKLMGDTYRDIIAMPLPADESIPACEKTGQEEEEEQPEILEMADVHLPHNDDHSVHAELDSNMERDLENNDCASPDMLPEDASEETSPGLELCEDEPGAQNGLAEFMHQAAAEEEEVDPNEHYNTNTGNASDGCQITERRRETTSEVACEASKDSEKGEEEIVNAENMEDGCQIAPCENECGEEIPVEHSDENLQTEGASLHEDGMISDSLLCSLGIKPEMEDGTVEEHSENTVEASKSDELHLKDNEVEANSLSKSIPSSPQEVPCEEDIEICKHSKINVDCGTKHVLHENLAVPEVVIVTDKSEERETSSDSLDDPYVLPEENEIVHDAQTDLGADHSKRGELGMDGENNLLPIDCKSIVTRTRSLSGRIPGYVPETVLEETGPETDLPSSQNGSGTEDLSNNSFSLEEKPVEANRALPTKSRRFILYPRSYSVEGRELPISVYRESDVCVLDGVRIKRTEDNLSLPCVNGSSGSFSQQNHLSSCGVSTPSSAVDIPPPFELAYITKKPITKSSPSLLIENDSPAKYSKKKKSSFKRFLTLKFKKKSENKVHVDVNVCSSRSSSESSYHGPPRLMELEGRSLSSSPQLKSHVGKLRASESPSAVLFYKDGKKKGTSKSFSRSVSRVESFEDRSRPPFMPLPLTKPRSISFPNADTSDYENIPAMSSDYENIQIPPRRCTRAGTFTEFFEDPSRALSAANENDGYVDMSSFTGFENKQQITDQETESAYTEPYKVCPVSMTPMEVVTSDEEQKSSEDDESSLGDPSLTNKKEGQSRAYLIAQELMSSEKVYVEMLQLLHMDFYEGILKVLGDDDENEQEEVKLKQGLSELPEIYELHQDILEELEERVLKWDEHQKVADVFLSRKSRLNHHTAYIMQFDRNLALLDETCLKYSQLATMIQEFEQSSGDSPYSVKHQLLKVVHRVFQYRVMLTAALFIVSEITDQANDSMLQAENLQKLVHIEHSVRGQSDLLQPGRIFVKEGTLMKVSGKNRRPRHLFLMNDVLLYTYPQKDGKYRLKNTLPVSGMKVSRPVIEKAQNILKIEYDEHCLTLSASSCSERDDWYSCISKHIPDDCKAHKTSTFHSSVELRERLGIPLGERPPTLVPVSHVMMCMNCGCDFTLTLRRHHCHACGKIVCRNCSRNKYPMKYLKDQAAKVCDSCYAELKKRERPLSVSFPPTSSRCSSSAFSSVFHNIHYSSFKKQKRIPSALMEVAASGEGATISGYLNRCKGGKRHWKKRWFVIKGKVLYTYIANEDKVATESLPLLGFTITPEKEEGSVDTVFHLYHKQTLFYSFRAEDNNSAHRWIEAMEEASIL
ncbi:PREDICTED: FYVE, RhoGEF and PH domain-containing protein 5 isoform X3 [Pseudopodoces humilis]|uniref:FYVE, RhoGEF and PH domain-containing protein 5 isoform X3 n=1 Tax=Pseudopodoces humilis TaxID=181119 RepID=UPI0006B8719E|nr:PREDICTED: FYVE, RhoGEF and PH domain-containing protein 5 isoform X3 [Pseudopodoces humilis]